MNKSCPPTIENDQIPSDKQEYEKYIQKDEKHFIVDNFYHIFVYFIYICRFYYSLLQYYHHFTLIHLMFYIH